MTPNRVVALLTPLVFAPLAGAVAAWLANHAPGLGVKEDDLQEIFIAGALIALAPAAQWLHGWQKYEARKAEADIAIQVAAAAAGPPVADVGQPADTFDDTSSDVDDFVDDADEFDLLDDETGIANGLPVAAGG